ncbi:MAG: PEP-CTERM sorting domain-containing protein, partial [Candidatus Cloacimonetes bacterium]|nr:PEP-CTERM sorting domain-containing protein [Candidatus Cloacimonadota bacterium]
TAQQAAATTVPEPSTLGLMFVALGSALLRRRSL